MKPSVRIALISFLMGVTLGVCGTLWGQAIKKESLRRAEGEPVSVEWKVDHLKLSKANLYDELVAQGVEFPEIVLAQAILETGHFKSNACISKNNLFGLKKRGGTYMSFSHWTDCVAAYKEYIQKWEKGRRPPDYYEYLRKLGYAKDPRYAAKLKEIVKKK